MSKGEWTHNICVKCWYYKKHASRQPTRMVDPPAEFCCYCGAINSDGIYTRENPASVELTCG